MILAMSQNRDPPREMRILTKIRERFVSRCCWDLRLEKLSKSSSKIMIAAEGVESKHPTELKHQE